MNGRFRDQQPFTGTADIGAHSCLSELAMVAEGQSSMPLTIRCVIGAAAPVLKG
jgi:hypothetical protein